jgi:hypothetical protein
MYKILNKVNKAIIADNISVLRTAKKIANCVGNALVVNSKNIEEYKTPS